MDSITDPKILAIMSKLDDKPTAPKQKDPALVGAGDPNRPTRPPLTLEEFIKAERLEDWPLPLTSEKFMGAPDDKDIIGSQESIMKQLTDATPVDMKFLAALEDRLQALEDRLHVYASQIVTTNSAGEKNSEKGSEKLLPSLGRTFMTDMQESDAVKAHPSRKSKKKMDFKESLLETKKKGVEYCVFPGFRQGELTELPGQLEAPQLLNRVTKAQDFNPGFKKFWKKIFQSEASVAIMQDTFWWIFMDVFQKKTSKDKDRMFDRIADSFVALFTSIHHEIKDKFFQVYSDCLAQAVFAAFREAFPESDRSFQDDFKTRLLNVVSEWITGIHPPPKQWQKWDMRRLEPKVYKMAEDNQTQAAKSLLDSNNKDVSYTLDVDDFKRTVARLGNNTSSPSRAGTAATPRISREGREGGAAAKPSMAAIGAAAAAAPTAPALLALPSSGGPGATLSRQAECGSPKRTPYQESDTKPTPARKSHQVGPGPELQRTLFNLQGHSPLVAHYLRLRQLKGPEQPGRRVRRTEITKLPPKALTYRQVINETLSKSDTLSKEYQKICDMTNQEIAKIERQQREMNQNISRLQKELMFCKNSMEVKILSESILDKRERDAALVSSKEKGRGSDDA